MNCAARCNKVVPSAVHAAKVEHIKISSWSQAMRLYKQGCFGFLEVGFYYELDLDKQDFGSVRFDYLELRVSRLFKVYFKLQMLSVMTQPGRLILLPWTLSRAESVIWYCS